MSLSRDDLETLKLAATEGAACQATLWQAVRILAQKAVEDQGLGMSDLAEMLATAHTDDA